MQRKLVLAHLGKSSALLEEGDYDGAQEAVEYTLALIFELFGRDTDIFVVELPLCLLVLAAVHHHYEELEEAATLYDQVEAVYRRLGMAETVEMAKLYHNQAVVLDDMVSTQALTLANPNPNPLLS